MQRWLTDLLHDEVADLDQLASRFRADSQLSAVNRTAGRWTDVSWDFVAVLSECLRAADATDGLVDPLLGQQLVAAGYDQWAGQNSGDGDIVAQQVDGLATSSLSQGPRIATSGRRTGAWQAIEIRPGGGAAQVRIPAGSALDLGAVAKGWLADRLARIVHTSTSFDVLANMGGDLRVISPGEPWTVAAESDEPGVDVCAMEVTDAGLATSGIGHRAWAGGHHIIDPGTGRPADTCWTSVSVLAAEAAGANAAATASMVLSEHGPAWLERMGLDGWFVSRCTQRYVGGWPTAPRHAMVRA